MPITTSYLEAVLFASGEPLTLRTLADVFSVSEESVVEVARALRDELATGERGITLVEDGAKVALVSIASASEYVTHLTNEDNTRELSKASLETLTIILYHTPISRHDIDYIRGVNSQHILRTLRVRGLIETCADLQGVHGTLFRPTCALLAHLGITSVDELSREGEAGVASERIIQFVNESEADPNI
jgi:segregation and condensation protein B